jgi:hypothetical protein
VLPQGAPELEVLGGELQPPGGMDRGQSRHTSSAKLQDIPTYKQNPQIHKSDLLKSRNNKKKNPKNHQKLVADTSIATPCSKSNSQNHFI